MAPGGSGRGADWAHLSIFCAPENISNHFQAFPPSGRLTLTGSGADVGDEASPAGVRLGGALLAGVPPGPADGGAAEGFGADDPAQLALTHLVADLREARPRPVVCTGREARRSSQDR